MVSADKSGMIEYWTGPKYDYIFPKNVRFESKLDTDLFEFMKVYFKATVYFTGSNIFYILG